MSEVHWTDSALEDLRGLRDFIARDSIHYADKFVDDIFSIAEELSSFPERGRVVPERNNQNIRELIYGSYRIIYYIGNESVTVITVIHSRRLY